METDEETVIGPNTQQRACENFVTEEVSTREFKNLSEPIGIHRVLRSLWFPCPSTP